jgi:hypothetical protein
VGDPGEHVKKKKPKAGRLRFEVGGRRYEGTLGEITEQYTRDRRKAGVEWPGGVTKARGSASKK